MSNFCNKNVTVEAWYAICKSKEIKRGSVKKFAIGPVGILIRRFRDSHLVASERYCPHMGTDLTLATELPGNTFRCAFHGLEFNIEGYCVSSGMEGKSGYRVLTYPIKEKYGLIWVYLGETPKYEIPELNLNGGFLLNLPSKKIEAHHHIVICNPLDNVHVGLVHALEVHKFEFKRDGVYITENVSGTYRTWWMDLLLRAHSEDMQIKFSSFGSSISVADSAWHKTRVVILFTARQDENNKCYTNTVIWMNSWNPLDWIRALIVILMILKQDIDILNSINVKTNFTDLDEGMKLFTNVVDTMPIYHSLDH